MVSKKLFNKAVHSSNNHTWKTPKGVYDYLDKEFKFVFDPCPSKPSFDGLNCEWSDMNFVNPPYGTELPKWINKAIIEQQKKHYSVLLIPSRTDTKWFSEIYNYATEIRFIVGRIKFVGAVNSAPFPSMIVIFGAALPLKFSMISIPR